MFLTVLMIDDHPPIIEGYKAILTSGIKKFKLNIDEAYSAQYAYELITKSTNSYDVVLLDLSIPPYEEKEITSGEQLIPIVKKNHPKAKVIILTSHTESIILHKIIEEYNPEGIFVKSDVQSKELIKGFTEIVEGKKSYTQTVISLQKTWNDKSNKVFDTYNQQILLLLNQGVKTKNLPELLHLSQSAVDKRKAVIKSMLGIEKGNDEDILKAARKQGLI